MEQKHSPLPWTWENPHKTSYGQAHVNSEAVAKIAVCGEAAKKTPHGYIGCMDYKEVEANAAFIVRAVNNHNKLVAALKELLGGEDDCHGDIVTECAGCGRTYSEIARIRVCPSEDCPRYVARKTLAEAEAA